MYSSENKDIDFEYRIAVEKMTKHTMAKLE